MSIRSQTQQRREREVRESESCIPIAIHTCDPVGSEEKHPVHEPIEIQHGLATGVTNHNMKYVDLKERPRAPSPEFRMPRKRLCSH